MVDVGLRGDDVVGRAGPHGVEDPLVMRCLEAHARVHDDAPAVGEEQIGGGAASRAEDVLGDGVGRVVVRPGA